MKLLGIIFRSGIYILLTSSCIVPGVPAPPTPPFPRFRPLPPTTILARFLFYLRNHVILINYILCVLERKGPSLPNPGLGQQLV
jgi:hypothetical protein